MVQRVLVVYPFLPHYREGVFVELDRTPTLDVVFAGDVRGRAGIEVMDSGRLSNFRHLRTMRWRNIEFQPGILRLFLSRRFDTVVFLGDVSSVSTWAAAGLARLLGTRVFFWTIGWHRPERGAKRLVRLAFYHLAHTLLLYGNMGRDLGISMGYPAQRMIVIGNSISVPSPHGLPVEQDPIRRPGDAQICVGAVARITTTKRFDLLIDASAILKRRGHRVAVKLAGDGPALEYLQRRAQHAQVRLDLIPPIYAPTRLAEFYANLDATVVPQAIGLTVIQSLGYGVPAISADNPHAQMPEWESIIPGVTGDLYAEGDAESLADAIVRTWRLRQTKECSPACRTEYAKRWCPPIHARNVVEAISSP